MTINRNTYGKDPSRIFINSPFRIPSSRNLVATSVDVLIEIMILEPDETNGGVCTTQDITLDVVKGTDVGRQDAGNDVLTGEDTPCTECQIY